MPIDPHTAPRTDHEPLATSPRALMPKTIAEAITLMLKGFGEFPDERRIEMYLDTLQDCLVAEVWAAVRTWTRQPHDRSARPGELRELITRGRGEQAAVQAHEAEWARQRVTPAEKQEIIRTLTPSARKLLQDACPWLFQDEVKE